MRILCLALLVCLPLFSLLGQKSSSISGVVKDNATGETLIGATVQIKELPTIIGVTNSYGFYSLNAPNGSYTLVFNFVGYSKLEQKVTLTASQTVDAVMMSDSEELEEVLVTATRTNDNVTKAQMGVEKLNVAQIAKIPVIFGEKDIVKTMQLLPGVKSAGEGSSGFFVRGGGADGNLILLDEAPVYNASHLLGFFSVFNSDAIKDVTLYKGTQPAQYGGKLSSVLDVKMNDGNSKKFGVSGGIGLIASRLMIEGPIKKDKGSFMVSGRRTYADLFLKLSSDPDFKDVKLYFYDFNAKLNYSFNDKNKLFISGYFGKDVLGFGESFGLNWGNATATARFNHLFNPRLFSSTVFIFSNYDYKFNLLFGGNEIDVLSRIQDLNFKQELQFFPNSNNNIKVGFNSIFHKLIPGKVAVATDVESVNTNLTNKRSWENAIYFTHMYKPYEFLNLEYGLRLSAFSVLGGGDFYTFDEKGGLTSTTYYEKNDIVENYVTLEPRLNISYLIDRNNSLKLGYARNSQNIHVASNATSGNPTDVYLPSSNNVKAQIADQISLGYFRNLNDDSYEFSAETYYKMMSNQIDYRDGADINFNEYLEGQLLYGEGRAYGVEFLARKKAGDFTGWVSYTLSRTERQIDGINKNKWYPSRQDRTHDVAIVGIYTINPKWSVSSTWVYYTGNAVSFPSGKYKVNGYVVNLYTERNGYRMPAYHRMDVGVTWLRKKTATFESSWNFSIYNLYGRENAYTITFEEDPNNPEKTQAVKTSLFKFVPSVTYNLKF